MSEGDLKARYVYPGRTLWMTLWHVANAEFGYIDQVVGPLEGIEPVTDSEPSDVQERLQVIREIFIRRVSDIPPEKRADVVYPTWTPTSDEPWVDSWGR